MSFGRVFVFFFFFLEFGTSWLHPVQHVTVRLDKEKDFPRRGVEVAAEHYLP